MKLQFKVQQFQTEAVEAVLDVFSGQPRHTGLTYRIDPGKASDGVGANQTLFAAHGLRNAEIVLSPKQLLDNIQQVQKLRNLEPSAGLAPSNAAPAGTPNISVEMETGTGKTYVYIKTMMELNRRYGWSKFIVVVPSIAIREGVKKTFAVTAEHFQQEYGTKPRAFTYNSSKLHELERFSSDAGVQVMIINIQAFNSSGKDNRRIYEVLDDFQSRKPIDVIAANRPVLIIDEPQRFGEEFNTANGKAKRPSTSLQSLHNLNALAVLRYSATHKPHHEYNKVHRLDAVDAYNQKLVKRIAVRGITVRGLAGSTAYLYLDAIEIAKGAKPRARVEIEVQTKGGEIRRMVKRLEHGANLHDVSGGIEAYKGLFVTEVNARTDTIELSNGDVVTAGDLCDKDVTEQTKRRIQIREVIRCHLDKERTLHAQGVKVLSLFFIDEVAKYRDYSREDTLGEYARIFEEEYEAVLQEVLAELELDGATKAFRDYLLRDKVREVHGGYFSIDRKTGAQVDPETTRSQDEGTSAKNARDYDLILRDKEKLLSLDTKLRFLFSHSALREGWDNPNVFLMGMLKRSDNTVSRRQEIGRGLRLSVDQNGERTDNPLTVHDINQLTVVCDESYDEFVSGLQREIAATLSARPRQASEDFFKGKTIDTPDGPMAVEGKLAKAIYAYLLKNDYVDEDGYISQRYIDDKAAHTLAEPSSEMLKTVINYCLPLVDSLYLDLPKPTDSRRPKKIPLNEANFAKREFQKLWGRINHKAVYQVEFDSAELVQKCVAALDKHLTVAALQYVVRSGAQRYALDPDDLDAGTGFDLLMTKTHTEVVSAGSQVVYDLLGEVAEKTQLTRRTTSAILRGVQPETFGKFKVNPEQFITEAARLVNEQKAAVIVEHLTYDTLDARFDAAIFTENQAALDLTKAGDKLKRHIYDYVATDSKVERAFVTELDKAEEVAVYAKLPRGFFIPTPVGDYNPDWAIAFKEGSVRHVYFVAETKGSLSTLQLKGVEEVKIECARRFFGALNAEDVEGVQYGVVTNYSELMELVTA